jgi:protein-S-isoprenylcysteine O-methyltransferase Ste14
MARAYRRRIAAEELLLQRNLPGYDRYVSGTKMLIPNIW